MGINSKTPSNLAGYIQFYRKLGFYFNDKLETEVFDGMNFTYVKKILKKHNILLVPEYSKKDNRDTTKLYIRKINGQDMSDCKDSKKKNPSMNLYRIFLKDFFGDPNTAIQKFSDSKARENEILDTESE